MFKNLRRNNSVSGRKRALSSLPTPLEASVAIGNSDYALKCHRIMELYWSIRDLGVQAVFDVPRVVVIGGQSSGKSSLVEAVSGITVPRDSGTCTRCPMDCSMSSDASSWSCTLSLSREFDKEGNRLSMPRIEPFGPVIEDKALLELWIRRAQSANLSPHRPMSDFYSMTEIELKNNDDPEILPFSKNAIHIRLKDPNATDLTFVDMPGLIQNADEAIIALVRNLVENYIAMPNTLIVVAMPMTDDIENMQALALAKDPKVDPYKQRTIGVLTKPDTLGDGSRGRRDAWRKLLYPQQDEERVDKHGYYCVRLLHDDERSRAVSKFEAERISAQFFETVEPWCSIADRSRFGIPNFVKSISKLLIELIEKNLPSLQNAVNNELSNVQSELRNLPRLSTNDPTTDVMVCIHNFCKAITSDEEPGVHQLKLIQDNRYRYFTFKHDIEMTSPNFYPFENVHPISSRLNVQSQCEPRALADVREVIKKSIAWELPGNIPYKATQTLTLQYTSLWKQPSLLCFDDIVDNTRDFINVLLQENFGRYKELERYMRGFVFSEYEAHVQKTRRILERYIEHESTPMYTLNDSYTKEKATWVSKYKSMCAGFNSYPSPAYINAGSWDPLHILYHFPPPAPTNRPAASTWDDEINLISGVQAYFQIAHKRFIDYIPLTIEHELNQRFATSIHQTVLNAFVKKVQSGEVDLQDLVKEDPVVERKRKDLEDRKARLTQIKHKIDCFFSGGK
ncbi:Interferon-induced GTP-binding protein Mx [Psilocybe cubensis]|uniref:Uncharacterized protein n=2 Tax=Psilocybe cubensis TaxID=181762 RepID=A0A8H8CFP3_PSICU|nr:Interferon-induced GTP-binding protein Mx [Psilocybe cubensis]KAH9475551.1 Interferon-induced GTP-binding protein Mx [Psilocybe cubensis]